MSDGTLDRPVIVFDVLGTLVDQAGSLRRQVSAATGWEDTAASAIVARWLELVAEREQEIVAGDAPFVPSHVLDAEALERMAGEGVLPRSAVQALGDASQRLEPWPDTVDGVSRLAADAVVMGLSNASHRVLTAFASTSGIRWHEALSAEDAGTYKPHPAVYQLALSAASTSGDAPYLVAAHAWDLRAAAKAGLRTAYVPRPGGDPPAADDDFDLHAEDLGDLRAQLRG